MYYDFALPWLQTFSKRNLKLLFKEIEIGKKKVF